MLERGETPARTSQGSFKKRKGMVRVSSRIPKDIVCAKAGEKRGEPTVSPGRHSERVAGGSPGRSDDQQKKKAVGCTVPLAHGTRRQRNGINTFWVGRLSYFGWSAWQVCCWASPGIAVLRTRGKVGYPAPLRQAGGRGGPLPGGRKRRVRPQTKFCSPMPDGSRWERQIADMEFVLCFSIESLAHCPGAVVPSGCAAPMNGRTLIRTQKVFQPVKR